MGCFVTWFRKMKIAVKLGLGFGSVLALVIILGVFSLLQLSKINGSTVDIATNWLPSVRTIAELRFDTAALRRDTLNYVMATDKKQHYEEKIQGEWVRSPTMRRNTNHSSLPTKNVSSIKGSATNGTNTLS